MSAAGCGHQRSSLLIACGALGKEIVHIIRANGLKHMRIQCLPAELHNRPEKIPEAVRAKIRQARGSYHRIFVAYADCGTGGKLDKMLEEEGVTRLPGAHCYQFYAGSKVFDDLHRAEPGTFYLTDFLTRHFRRLVIEALGLDRHPELKDQYFANYRRLVYLAQSKDAALEAEARRAAAALELEFELRPTGFGELESTLVEFAAEGVKAAPPAVGEA